MTIEVVERPVVAHCSTVATMSWTELEANWSQSRRELELELTTVKVGTVYIYARNRFTGNLLSVPHEGRTTVSNFGLSHSYFFAPTGGIPEKLRNMLIAPQAMPLGQSTHHLVYLVDFPDRHEITYTWTRLEKGFSPSCLLYPQVYLCVFYI